MKYSLSDFDLRCASPYTTCSSSDLTVVTSRVRSRSVAGLFPGGGRAGLVPVPGAGLALPVADSCDSPPPPHAQTNGIDSAATIKLAPR